MCSLHGLAYSLAAQTTLHPESQQDTVLKLGLNQVKPNKQKVKVTFTKAVYKV